MEKREIIKILLTLFIAILIPVYWVNYGPTNFLWFSDIGLFMTVLALWFKSPLLISMVAIGVLPIEIAWNVDYFVHLVTGYSVFGIAEYMFDAKYSLLLRALSLFHVVTPPLWIYLLHKWGYDRRALVYWTILFWCVMILIYLVTDPAADINWVFVPTTHGWTSISQIAWLLFLLLAFPVFIFLPMHTLLAKICK